MKDWRFIYNHYVHHAKRIDGLLWDWPQPGMIVEHGEDFLNETVLAKRERFIDVGANVGSWTLRASPYYHRVIAFEPNRRIYESLRRNIALNRLRNVEPHNLAIDYTLGLTDQSILHSATPADPMGLARVETTTLDFENVITKDSLVKLDVEGSALRVIKGGLRTITAYRPTIIVEVHLKDEASVPSLLPGYSWTKHYRPAPLSGDWLYRENGKQVFLVGQSGS